MKLRIRGDSIRLRLSQAEVRKIYLGEPIVETTHFLNQKSLSYVLETSKSNSSIEAVFQDNTVTVRVPEKKATEWAGGEEVALHFEQTFISPKEGTLFILIEKDFQCLKERENENEDESDLFVNPNAAKGHC